MLVKAQFAERWLDCRAIALPDILKRIAIRKSGVGVAGKVERPAFDPLDDPLKSAPEVRNLLRFPPALRSFALPGLACARRQTFLRPSDRIDDRPPEIKTRGFRTLGLAVDGSVCNKRRHVVGAGCMPSY